MTCRTTGGGSQEFWGTFLASGVVWMGTDWTGDSFGMIFKPNGQFSTHCGPILMFWGWTGTLVSRDLDLGTFGQPMIWTWPDLT